MNSHHQNTELYYPHNSYLPIQTPLCILRTNRRQGRVKQLLLHRITFGHFFIRPIFCNIISTKQASEISTKTKNDNFTYHESVLIQLHATRISCKFQCFRSLEVTNVHTLTNFNPSTDDITRFSENYSEIDSNYGFLENYSNYLRNWIIVKEVEQNYGVLRSSFFIIEFSCFCVLIFVSIIFVFCVFV